MSDFVQLVSLPLDEDGFFRRECPFCMKEFKVLLKQEELNDINQREIDSFMLDQTGSINEDNEENDEVESIEYTCPYCGQTAPAKSWWTQEQLEYFKVLAKNLVADIVNEHLIKPMENTFRGQRSGFITMSFKGNEIEKDEAWISPETNDMKVFDLPCCYRKIKLNDERNEQVYCFFCGFPHNN